MKRELGKLVKFDDRITNAPIKVKQMRWLQASADGRVVFGAVGKIWIARPGATPQRLTASSDREYSPSLSPDGKWIAYVTWNDAQGGRLWKAPSDGSGAPVELSQAPAFYSSPEWSPDGSRIAFLMGSASGWLSEDASEIVELRVLPAAGGRSERVAEMRSPNAKVTWSGDGKRLFYGEVQTPAPTSSDPPSSTLISIRVDGVDKKTHVKFADLTSAVPSPDGTVDAAHAGCRTCMWRRCRKAPPIRCR